MISRPLFVAAGLALAASVAGCGGGGEDLGAPPVNSRQTSPASAPTTTAPSATTPTTAAAATTVPTTQPPTTTTTVPTLTPELEAELIDVYTNARRVLYEALLDPPNADLDAVARYWSPDGKAIWKDLLADWTSKGWRAEPGPKNLQYEEVHGVELVGPNVARLRACAVTDSAVYDSVEEEYLDPGLLTSARKDVELRLVHGAWLVFEDRQLQRFEGIVGCAP